MAKHLMLNGDILPADKPCLMHNNRGFLYADSFSFTLRGNSSKAFFIDEYFEYLLFALKSLNMERTLLLRKSGFVTDLELILQKNRIYKGFKALITVFRNADDSNKCSVLIVPEALSEEFYVQPQRGLRVLVYEKFELPEYIFKSELSPVYSQEFFIPSQFESSGIDDLLLVDSGGRIIRSTSASVFFVKSGNLITPTRKPVNNSKVFNDVVINAALESETPVLEWDVKEEDLYDIDEIFFADVVRGITPVLGFKEKRYYNKLSVRLTQKINEKLAIQIR